MGESRQVVLHGSDGGDNDVLGSRHAVDVAPVANHDGHSCDVGGHEASLALSEDEEDVIATAARIPVGMGGAQVGDGGAHRALEVSSPGDSLVEEERDVEEEGPASEEGEEGRRARRGGGRGGAEGGAVGE